MTKILLVEDDKNLREIYGVRLLAEGYDIVSAGDGEEALAMAIKERPALILSDVMMPKISGFDMLDILRSTTETKKIKVIIMTALSGEEQRQRGEELGADRYLVKSQVGIEDVVRTVHEVLGDRPDIVSLSQNESAKEETNEEPAAEEVAEPETAAQFIETPVATPEPALQAPAAAEPMLPPQDAESTQIPVAAPEPATTPTMPSVEPMPVVEPSTPQFIETPVATPEPALQAPAAAEPAMAPQPNMPEPVIRHGGEKVIQPLTNLNSAMDTDFNAKLTQELNASLPQNQQTPPAQ
ncbi:MAG: response regulator [Candidatus Saccharibacteria bacterium]|nr:response regulator [Candidatus Saccharibacteria bacterium]